MNWWYWAVGTALGTGVGVLIALGTHNVFLIALAAAAVSTSVKKVAQWLEYRAVALVAGDAPATPERFAADVLREQARSLTQRADDLDPSSRKRGTP